MLSFEEHPGIISALSGIVILVMTAVGLSLLVDRRLKASTGVIGIQREIDQNASTIDALRILHEQSSVLMASESQRKSVFEKNEATSAELKILGRRQNSLEKIRIQLRDAIVILEEDFSTYRADHQRKTWASAIGEQLGNLVLRGGREYKNVTITRVSDVGLEIRHSEGVARIRAPDLDQIMQDRFLWSNEDQRGGLKQE